MIRHAQIIEDNGAKNEIQIGRTVTFTEIPGDEEESYKIVGSAEADPFEGKISNESPIAKALIGKKLNQEVKDRKSTRLNSSHVSISYAVFCLKKKIKKKN